MGSSSKRRVCIIGGGGYFGQWVAKEFLQNGYDVVLMDIFFVENPAVKLDFSKVTKIKGSVTDKVAVEKALTDCDSCIHIAAYGMSGSPSLDPVKTRAVNVGGTEIVIGACLKLGVSRLVYTSTVGVVFADREVVNGDESMPYAEPERHSQFYTLTKMEAEKRVLSMDGTLLDRANKRSGEDSLRTCALRLRGIFGPGEPRTCERTVEMVRKGLLMATFGEREHCLTQWSGVANTATAHRQAEVALGPEGEFKAGGKPYFIVDGGDPVDSFEFFYPLLDSMNLPHPKIRVPYKLVYFFAFLMEWLWRLTGVEPVLTRLECNLIGLTNYYSIENARRDLGYNPTNNHDLQPTIDYFLKQHKQAGGHKKAQDGSQTALVILAGIVALLLLLSYFMLF